MDCPHYFASYYYRPSYYQRPNFSRTHIPLSHHMKQIKELVKVFNNVFIQIILVVFYIFGIGLGALLHAVFIKKKQTQTYWQNVKNEGVDLSSPY